MVESPNSINFVPRKISDIGLVALNYFEQTILFIPERLSPGWKRTEKWVRWVTKSRSEHEVEI